MSIRASAPMFRSGRPLAAPQARKRRVRSSFVNTTGPQLNFSELLQRLPTFWSDSGGIGGSAKASALDWLIPPQQELKYALKIFSLPAGPKATTTPAVASDACWLRPFS